MRVYGSSVIKGMLYTLKHFLNTYVEDFKRMTNSAQASIPHQRTLQDDKGICTVQYPEEELPIGAEYERFRVLPYLIYRPEEEEKKDILCTSCGICAKVCPPQCIWIVQETNDAGKPVPNPEEFYIDTSVCMNCGLCSEYCPFDAIKMSHDYKLTQNQDRFNYIYDLDTLLVPETQYAQEHPRAFAAEEEARRIKAEEDRKKAEAKAARLAAKKKKAAEEAAAKKAEAKDEKPKAEKTEAKDEKPKVEKTEAKDEKPKAEKTEAKDEKPKAEKTEAKDEKPKAEETDASGKEGEG